MIGWRSAALTAVLALLLTTAGLGAGFAAFVAATDRPAFAPPPADGIVALTGGAERVETALRLLAAGQAPLLLVSGVAHGPTLAELARLGEVDPAPLHGRVTLGRMATTTVGNATETAAWAQANGIHSLIVVTAGYHMPRALLELRRAMPDIQLTPFPVQTRRPLRVLALEYAKLIGAVLGVSHPVDKSVND